MGSEIKPGTNLDLVEVPKQKSRLSRMLVGLSNAVREKFGPIPYKEIEDNLADQIKAIHNFIDRASEGHRNLSFPFSISIAPAQDIAKEKEYTNSSAQDELKGTVSFKESKWLHPESLITIEDIEIPLRVRGKQRNIKINLQFGYRYVGDGPKLKHAEHFIRWKVVTAHSFQDQYSEFPLESGGLEHFVWMMPDSDSEGIDKRAFMNTVVNKIQTILSAIPNSVSEPLKRQLEELDDVASLVGSISKRAEVVGGRSSPVWRLKRIGFSDEDLGLIDRYDPPQFNYRDWLWVQGYINATQALFGKDRAIFSTHRTSYNRRDVVNIKLISDNPSEKGDVGGIERMNYDESYYFAMHRDESGKIVKAMLTVVDWDGQFKPALSITLENGKVQSLASTMITKNQLGSEGGEMAIERAQNALRSILDNPANLPPDVLIPPEQQEYRLLKEGDGWFVVVTDVGRRRIQKELADVEAELERYNKEEKTQYKDWEREDELRIRISALKHLIGRLNKLGGKIRFSDKMMSDAEIHPAFDPNEPTDDPIS